MSWEVIVQPFGERGVKKQAKMYFHRFDNAASFSLGSVSRAVHSSSFCHLQRLPLDERPPRSFSQSGPVPSRSRRHPKAAQQCQRWTDQENSSKAAHEVRPCSVPSGVEVKIRCSQGFNKSLYNNRHSVPAPRCQ